MIPKHDACTSFLIRLLITLLLVFFLIGPPCALSKEPPLSGLASACLVKSGNSVLWEHAAGKRLPPASLTKMMTALVVVELCKDLNAEVVISKAASSETGARIGLAVGDRMTVGTLLAAALLGSANDACHALAAHAAGSEKRFVSLMNLRAREWGLRDTHFVNACGHDHPQHFSSANDLAVIATKLLAVPILSTLVSLEIADIESVDHRRTFRFQNKNLLIGRYAGAIGVKTGFTAGAGKCLVAAAQRNGVRVLLVFLNAPNRWWAAVDMLDLAFKEVAGGA